VWAHGALTFHFSERNEPRTKASLQSPFLALILGTLLGIVAAIATMGIWSATVAARVVAIIAFGLLGRTSMTPLRGHITQQQNRERFQKFGMFLVALLACSGAANSQAWFPPDTPPPFNAGSALQLTDGNIMVQESSTSNWWKLTPNNFGLYHSGTWSKLASFPASMNYAPRLFASAVLPDGRVIIEGGEYNNGIKNWTHKGAIYDPVANFWTPVNPPTGWTTIGDAQSVVLPDGTFMLANKCPVPCTGGTIKAKAALLDAANLTWTVLNGTGGYIGKLDENTEEGWTLLPNGDLLTVDTYICEISCYTPNGMNSEIYNPITGVWSSAGSTGVQLWDSQAACGEATKYEVGPAALRPDGTVFATGANGCAGEPAHTAIYDTTTGTWTPGPNIPVGTQGTFNDMADAPAAVLPDGNVLIDSSPGIDKGPSTLFEFNGTGFITIPQPGLGPAVSSESGRMLVTPIGTILFIHAATTNMWFYQTSGTYQSSWQPNICSSCFPATVSVGGTYTVSGTQFNGLTQGAFYGDDYQSATNYPLVRITNDQTQHVFYARTHGFSTMGVATGAEIVSTKFDVLSGTETGPSTMVVAANGIPSNVVDIMVK
jgi:hypothetical protein